MKIPLTRPYITDFLKKQVCKVLDSGILTEGEVTRQFETVVGTYLDVKNVLAVSNCTVGLEMAMRAINIVPGDEIIVPDFTYPATASAGMILGANVKVVGVDRRTLLIDYDSLEAAITSRTKAVVPVSLFGNPLDYNRLAEIKEKYGVFIIEDAACALGAKFDDRSVGRFSDITVFSLHPRKFITTGEGGLITTNNEEWAEWLDSFKHFGMVKDPLDVNDIFHMVGGNYKLSNLQAAVGLAQMQEVGVLMDQRQRGAEYYRTRLAGCEGIIIPEVMAGGVSSYQSFCILIEHRDQIRQKLRDRGIEVQIGSYALHRQKAFRDNPNCEFFGSMSGSAYAFEHSLVLPLYHDITPHEQDHVIEALKQAIEERVS